MHQRYCWVSPVWSATNILSKGRKGRIILWFLLEVKVQAWLHRKLWSLAGFLLQLLFSEVFPKASRCASSSYWDVHMEIYFFKEGKMKPQPQPISLRCYWTVHVNIKFLDIGPRNSWVLCTAGHSSFPLLLLWECGSHFSWPAGPVFSLAHCFQRPLVVY